MRAASLEDRKLILECYHPSAQFTEPYLFCDYLGTPGLSDNIVGRGSIYERADALTREGMLNRLYSRFRPTSRDSDPTSRRPHPAGDIPGSRTSDAAISSRRSDAGIVKHNVSLDAHENFSQLLFNTSLVQIGPRRGVFSDIVPVIEKKTFRVFRQWLAEGAQETKEADRNTSRELPGEMESTNGKSYGNSETVWLDEDKKTAGFKIRIEERKWRRETPILLHKDEEQAVSYSLELNGKYINAFLEKRELIVSLGYHADVYQNCTSAPSISS